MSAAAGNRPKRRPSRQAEVARIVKALQKSGLTVAAVRMEPNGTVIVFPGTPGGVLSYEGNPWDYAS
jgi:hypothetical protein